MTEIDVDPDSLQEVLFAEIHHRFYNSLQVIASLAGGLCKDLSASSQRLRAMQIQDRVTVLADLHRLLAAPHGDDLLLSCTMLCATLASAFERQDVRFDLRIPTVRIDHGTARGLMLLLAELITNAIKHNIEVEDLLVDVELNLGSDGYELIVCDSGSVLPDVSKPPRVASQLAAKFGGVLSVVTDQGYRVRASIPTSMS